MHIPSGFWNVGINYPYQVWEWIKDNCQPKQVSVESPLKPKTIRDAIDEHWRGEPVKYFNSSDLLNIINGETYLKYEYKSEPSSDILWE